MGDMLERENQAAYNQSGRIVQILSDLFCTYISYMNTKDYQNAVKIIRRITDTISPKLSQVEIMKINNGIKSIEVILPQAVALYLHNGSSYIKNPKLNSLVEEAIEEVARYVNKLQDDKGYGMLSKDDPRFAVTKR